MGGHSIQNHTNSHQYSMIAGNLYTKGIDSFREQVELQDKWVTECTGIKPEVFRFPYRRNRRTSSGCRRRHLKKLLPNGQSC